MRARPAAVAQQRRSLRQEAANARRRFPQGEGPAEGGTGPGCASLPVDAPTEPTGARPPFGPGQEGRTTRNPSTMAIRQHPWPCGSYHLQAAFGSLTASAAELDEKPGSSHLLTVLGPSRGLPVSVETAGMRQVQPAAVAQQRRSLRQEAASARRQFPPGEWLAESRAVARNFEDEDTRPAEPPGAWPPFGPGQGGGFERSLPTDAIRPLQPAFGSLTTSAAEVDEGEEPQPLHVLTVLGPRRRFLVETADMRGVRPAAVAQQRRSLRQEAASALRRFPPGEWLAESRAVARNFEDEDARPAEPPGAWPPFCPGQGGVFAPNLSTDAIRQRHQRGPGCVYPRAPPSQPANGPLFASAAPRPHATPPAPWRPGGAQGLPSAPREEADAAAAAAKTGARGSFQPGVPDRAAGGVKSACGPANAIRKDRSAEPDAGNPPAAAHRVPHQAAAPQAHQAGGMAHPAAAPGHQAHQTAAPGHQAHQTAAPGHQAHQTAAPGHQAHQTPAPGHQARQAENQAHQTAAPGHQARQAEHQAHQAASHPGHQAVVPPGEALPGRSGRVAAGGIQRRDGRRADFALTVDSPEAEAPAWWASTKKSDDAVRVAYQRDVESAACDGAWVQGGIAPTESRRSAGDGGADFAPTLDSPEAEAPAWWASTKKPDDPVRVAYQRDVESAACSETWWQGGSRGLGEAAPNDVGGELARGLYRGGGELSGKGATRLLALALRAGAEPQPANHQLARLFRIASLDPAVSASSLIWLCGEHRGTVPAVAVAVATAQVARLEGGLPAYHPPHLPWLLMGCLKLKLNLPPPVSAKVLTVAAGHLRSGQQFSARQVAILAHCVLTLGIGKPAHQPPAASSSPPARPTGDLLAFLRGVLAYFQRGAVLCDALSFWGVSTVAWAGGVYTRATGDAAGFRAVADGLCGRALALGTDKALGGPAGGGVGDAVAGCDAAMLVWGLQAMRCVDAVVFDRIAYFVVSGGVPRSTLGPLDAALLLTVYSKLPPLLGGHAAELYNVVGSWFARQVARTARSQPPAAAKKARRRRPAAAAAHRLPAVLAVQPSNVRAVLSAFARARIRSHVVEKTLRAVHDLYRKARPPSAAEQHASEVNASPGSATADGYGAAATVASLLQSLAGLGRSRHALFAALCGRAAGAFAAADAAPLHAVHVLRALADGSPSVFVAGALHAPPSERAGAVLRAVAELPRGDPPTAKETEARRSAFRSAVKFLTKKGKGTDLMEVLRAAVGLELAGDGVKPKAGSWYSAPDTPLPAKFFDALLGVPVTSLHAFESISHLRTLGAPPSYVHSYFRLHSGTIRTDLSLPNKENKVPPLSRREARLADPEYVVQLTRCVTALAALSLSGAPLAAALAPIAGEAERAALARLGCRVPAGGGAWALDEKELRQRFERAAELDACGRAAAAAAAARGAAGDDPDSARRQRAACVVARVSRDRSSTDDPKNLEVRQQSQKRSSSDGLTPELRQRSACAVAQVSQKRSSTDEPKPELYQQSACVVEQDAKNRARDTQKPANPGRVAEDATHGGATASASRALLPLLELAAGPPAEPEAARRRAFHAALHFAARLVLLPVGDPAVAAAGAAEYHYRETVPRSLLLLDAVAPDAVWEPFLVQLAEAALLPARGPRLLPLAVAVVGSLRRAPKPLVASGLYAAFEAAPGAFSPAGFVLCFKNLAGYGRSPTVADLLDLLEHRVLPLLLTTAGPSQRKEMLAASVATRRAPSAARSEVPLPPRVTVRACTTAAPPLAATTTQTFEDSPFAGAPLVECLSLLFQPSDPAL
ncbi:hypothetical protein DIPPA_16880 [Diplonema papillatum]|nr:hypothetical protein DIPPA_16880 [Diplonema papillatum]